MQQKSYIFMASAKKISFSLFFSIKKTSFSLFPFLLGFLEKILFFYVWFFCVWKIVSHFVYLSFFCFWASFFWTLFFSFTFFWSIKKKRCSCWKMEQKLYLVFCFCSLGFQNMLCPKKIRFIFPLFLICCINSSLSLHLKPLKIMPKNLHFLFLFRPFFCFACFLSTFFLIFYHLCFLCSLFPFILLFIPFCFSLLLLFFLYFSISCFLVLFFSIAVFVYLHFVCTSLFFSLSLSFVLDLFCILLLYLFFHHLRICYFGPEIFKNFCGQFFLMKFCLCFLNSPFFGVSSLVFSPLRRPHSLFVQCFTDNERFLTLLLLLFFYQFSFWISWKNCRFVFGQKFQKNIIDTLLIIFETLVFLEFHQFLLLRLFFMHDLQKHFAIFLCFQSFFWKISCFFCRSPFVSVQKKNHLEKKNITLFIFLFFFAFSSSFILSHLCHIFMFTLLAVSLLILHAFSLFFSSFFLFPCYLSFCLPLTMFIYSFSLSCFFCLFLQKNHLYLFFVQKILFICSSLLAKLFLFHLLCCFAPFSHLFFQSCSFEQEKLTPFFLLAEKQFV